MANENSLMEFISDTTPKYGYMADELVPFLLDLLRGSNELERKMDKKYFEMEEERRRPGTPPRTDSNDINALFAEHYKLFYEIAKDKCTEELLARQDGRGFGANGEYGYIDEEFQLKFTMKSAKKAIIETHFYKGPVDHTKHQFTLKLTDDGWRISEKKYSYDTETTWYKDKI